MASTDLITQGLLDDFHDELRRGLKGGSVIVDGAVFDISEHNSGASYASLSAALGTNGANVPAEYRRGGMSVKFVLTSDNKYVQYRFMLSTFTAAKFTNVANWERYNDITASNQSNSDLDISDEQSNVLIRVSNGHIKTKNFDSSKDATTIERGLMSSSDKVKLNDIEEGAQINDVITDEVEDVDLNISDEDGNILIQAKDGHIKTKNFDSASIREENLSDEAKPLKVSENSKIDFSVEDENGNAIIQCKNGGIRTSTFNSNSITADNLSPSVRKHLVTKNNLAGKRVSFLGDSITQQSSASSQKNTYHGVFCSLYGAIDRTAEIHNDPEWDSSQWLAINGTCIAANTKNGNSKRFVTRATAENFADSKLIVIFGGTNDLSYDRKPIGNLFVEETITATGNMGDKRLIAPTDTETFAGALHELITTIQNVAPKVPIVIMTPMKRDHNSVNNPDYLTCNSNGDYMVDFVNAIKGIAAFYSIPVLDLYSNSQLNPLAPGWSSLFGDGLHPNNEGHRLIGKLLFDFVENNVVIE